MIFYGLKNCDACKLLLKSQPHFKLIDVSLTPVPDDILMVSVCNVCWNLLGPYTYEILGRLLAVSQGQHGQHGKRATLTRKVT